LRLLLAPLCLLLAACSTGDAVRAARILATGDVAGAQVMAAEKAVRYAANPQALAWDIKAFKNRLESFRKAVDAVWGPKDREEPTPRRYVKYSGDYLSRAMVDFDAGTVTVETVDQKTPQASLEAAVTATVLAPADPRAVDLYSASDITWARSPSSRAGQGLRGPGHPLGVARQKTSPASWWPGHGHAHGAGGRPADGALGALSTSCPGTAVRAARYAEPCATGRRFAVSENLSIHHEDRERLQPVRRQSAPPSG
jgi:membrane-bound lytic murein transglycosylase C